MKGKNRAKDVEQRGKKKKKKELPPEYTETGGLNYAVYYMKPQERMMYILLAAAGLFALGFIFYRSIPLSLLFALLSFFYPNLRTKQIISARRRRLTLQFKDMLYSLSSAIGAGNSVERAMTIALEDMERQYAGGEALIVKELELIVSKLSMNQNIEALLTDLGKRSGVEDIGTFANIFEVSKRTGGNLIQIIRQASQIITEKIETKNEMDTMLAEKKMEQKILTVVPIALVLLLTETTGGFMDPIFNSFMGRVVATIALVLIGVGFLWGKKLTDIQI